MSFENDWSRVFCWLPSEATFFVWPRVSPQHRIVCLCPKCTSLKELEFAGLPALRVIEQGAFSGCRDLCAVDLSNGLESLAILGSECFSYCSSLRSVVLRGLGSLEFFGDALFSYCVGLKSVDITGCHSLRVVGAAAFLGSTLLESIQLDEAKALSSIGDDCVRRVFFPTQCRFAWFGLP